MQSSVKHVVQPVAHSPLGPSGAPRWINCPGSVNASKGIVDEESVFAAEGTAAHWLADACFRKNAKAADYIGWIIEVGKHKFGVVEEFADAVQEYLDWCGEVPADVSISEAKVSYESWIPGGFGWVDRAMIKDGQCTIRDLKFGKGVQVWAKGNEQMLMQAIGMLETYWMEDIQEFELGIHQPRLDHKDTWRVSRAELLTWAKNTLVPTLAEIKVGRQFTPGEWCQFCKFKLSCAVRANVGLQNVFGNLDLATPADAVPVPQIEMSPERKASILPLLATMKSWLADFEKGVIADLIAGKTLSGWKLVEGRANRKWSNPDAVAKRISPEDAFEKRLRSPAQIEKLLGKPKFSKVLGELVEKPPGKPKLAGPDDPRPPMTNLSEANFTDLDNEE